MGADGKEVHIVSRDVIFNEELLISDYDGEVHLPNHDTTDPFLHATGILNVDFEPDRKERQTEVSTTPEAVDDANPTMKLEGGSPVDDEMHLDGLANEI